MLCQLWGNFNYSSLTLYPIPCKIHFLYSVHCTVHHMFLGDADFEKKILPSLGPEEKVSCHLSRVTFALMIMQ